MSEAGICFFKRNRSTLRLVLPAKMKFLNGRYGTRQMVDNRLVVTVSLTSGEVKFFPVSRKVHNPTLSIGRYSSYFRPGPARFVYEQGVLTVWQE